MIRNSKNNVHAPLQFYVGDTWEIEVSCHDAAGEALNLTGAAIQWKLESGDGQELLVLSIGSGLSLVGAATLGKVLVTVTKDQTSALGAGYYRDQTRVTLASGFVSTQSLGLVEAMEGL